MNVGMTIKSFISLMKVIKISLATAEPLAANEPGKNAEGYNMRLLQPQFLAQAHCFQSFATAAVDHSTLILMNIMKVVLLHLAAAEPGLLHPPLHLHLHLHLHEVLPPVH